MQPLDVVQSGFCLIPTCQEGRQHLLPLQLAYLFWVNRAFISMTQLPDGAAPYSLTESWLEVFFKKYIFYLTPPLLVFIGPLVIASSL